MTEIRDKILGALGSMVRAWAYGDMPHAQRKYEYIQGICESANIDFNNALIGGLKHLQKQCIGVKDSMMYSGYINGSIPGFMQQG